MEICYNNEDEKIRDYIRGVVPTFHAPEEDPGKEKSDDLVKVYTIRRK